MKIILRVPNTAPLDLRLPRVTTDDPRDTERLCSSQGCENPARQVEGHYFVGSRRVRVWVCFQHWSEDSLQELPMPPSIAFAMVSEQQRQEKIERIMRNQGELVSESVRAFAPSGSGATPKFNSADSFHWGENPGDVETRIHAISPREAMIIRIRNKEKNQ